MNGPVDDFEERFARRFRRFVDEATETSDARVAMNRAKSRPVGTGPRLRGGFPGALSFGVVGVVLVFMIVGRLSVGPGAPSPSPDVTPVLSPAATSGESQPATGAVPTPGATAIAPEAWILAQIDSPPGVAGYELLGASADGSTVLFRDREAYDELRVLYGGTIRAVAAPTHESGTPVFGRLNPARPSVVFDDSGRLWQHDLLTGATGALADFGGLPVEWYVFTSPSTLAVLTALMDTPVHPSQLWTLDLVADEVSEVGEPGNWEIAYSTAAGVVLQTNLNAGQGVPHIVLYRVQDDGATHLLYDAGAAGLVRVSTDGHYVAYSDTNESGGVWVVEVATGEKRQIVPNATVMSFSPDGKFLAVRKADGAAVSYSLDGEELAALPDADHVAWVAKE